MSDAGFVIGGYVVVFGTLAAYTARLILRGRALTRQVPAGKRRWSGTDE